MNEDKTQRGIKGPIKSLQKAWDRIESGDKILLADGSHSLGKSFKRKDVRIEGIGECDIAFGIDDSEDDVSAFHIQHKVSLSNIKIDNEWMTVKVQGTLWMTDCAFDGEGSGVLVRKHGRLDLLNVQFIGPNFQSVIRAAEHSSISACGCLFDDCGGGDDSDPCIELHVESESVSLRLVRNMFKNLPTIPIGGEYSTRIKVNDNAIFRNNRVGHSKSDGDVLHAFTN